MILVTTEAPEVLSSAVKATYETAEYMDGRWVVAVSTGLGCCLDSPTWPQEGIGPYPKSDKGDPAQRQLSEIEPLSANPTRLQLQGLPCTAWCRVAYHAYYDSLENDGNPNSLEPRGETIPDPRWALAMGNGVSVLASAPRALMWGRIEK